MYTEITERIANGNSIWKQLDQGIAWAIIAVGLGHCLITPVHIPQFGTRMLWFFSGGLAIISQGVFNLLRIRYGSMAAGLKRICMAANLIGLAFGIAMMLAMGTRAWRDPLSLVFLAMITGATAFSLAPAPPDTERGRRATTRSRMA